MTLTLRERFEAKVMPEPMSGCWLWTGGCTSGGYGGIGRGKGEGDTSAHRVSYELHVGPIPDGLEIDHLCRTRCCVNPAHLEAVTRKVNLGRGLHRNRGKARCVHGHEFTAENTYVTRKGVRQCIACSRARTRRYRKDRG